jgi:hypothetical protein
MRGKGVDAPRAPHAFFDVDTILLPPMPCDVQVVGSMNEVRAFGAPPVAARRIATVPGAMVLSEWRRNAPRSRSPGHGR